MVAVFDPHHLALRWLPSHSLHLRWVRLLEAGTVWASPNKAFGSVFFMETEMVDQLLLDLEGFATFFTLVPVAKIGKGKEKNKKQQNLFQYISKAKLHFVRISRAA